MATTTIKTEESVNYSFGDWKSQNELRINFIVKVYTILTAEAFLSTFGCLMSLTYDSIYLFQNSNIWLTFLLSSIWIMTNFFAVYYSEPFKDGVYAVLIMTVYTFSQAYVFSHICLATNPQLVMMIMFMGFAFIFALMMFYAISRNEFKTIGAIVFCSLVSLALFFIFVYISENGILLILLCCLLTIVYGMYITYDTLLILGNKELNLTQNDYILASFFYYSDIFSIFISMFQILNFMRDLKEEEKQEKQEN
jgi:FtsH-binding integral membrane protein